MYSRSIAKMPALFIFLVPYMVAKITIIFLGNYIRWV